MSTESPKSNLIGPYTLAFVSGATLMIVELCSARILATFFGSSIHVWAGIIAATLLASSFGAWHAGKILEKSNTIKVVANNLYLAGLGSILTAWSIPIIATKLSLPNLPPVLPATLVALAGLGLPAYALGGLFPTATKWAFDLTSKIGRSAGSCSAISTLGSVFGTLLTPIAIIPNIPLSTTFLFLGASISIAGLLIKYSHWKILPLVIACIVASTDYEIGLWKHEYILLDKKESQYQTIRIFNKDNTTTIMLNRQPAGAIKLENYLQPEVFDYTKFWRLIGDSTESKKALYLGGGAYTQPTAHARNRPQDLISVVEIDPMVTSMAEKFLGKPTTIKTIHEDARVALGTLPDDTYDFIFMDTFADAACIPVHLATTKFFDEIKSKLRPDGMLLINVISDRTSERNVRSYISAAVSKNFKYLKTFECPARAGVQKTNFVLVATSLPIKFSTTASTDEILSWETQNKVAADAPSDDFTVIDYLQ